VPIKIEQGFVNKTGNENYFIVTCKNEFILYIDKLDKVFDGRIVQSESIRTVDFDYGCDHFYIGSDKAKLYKYSIKD
jgi:hypothetical protein